jgi:WD40 repeat protein
MLAENTRFFSDNRKAIFEGKAEEKEVFAKLIATLYPPEVAAPLLRHLETTSTGNDQRIWQAARQQSLSGSTFSPDGRTMVTTAEDRVQLWSADNGRLLRSFTPPGLLSRVSFSPDGRQLVITTMDGSSRTWDIQTGMLLREARPVR